MPKSVTQKKLPDSIFNLKPNCSSFTDRAHPFMKGTVVNLSEESITGITSDFHNQNWTQFEIPRWKSTIDDLCVYDTDALYFKKGVLLWRRETNGSTTLVSHTTKSGILKIPDQNNVTAFSFLGRLHLIYDASNSGCLIGACPYIMNETQRLEAGLKDLLNISMVNPLDNES
ncbi:MAG: hypothetical protein HN337_07875 [Deltaproteobacteria bacterium]|jgi:hypothetical protein|nr:hypothetical protein [Deltaproteobacteria bacterium]